MNRDAYNRIADQWDAGRRELSGSEQAYLARFLDAVPPGGSILDAGCGTGRPMAEYAIARGYCITGVDQAVALLAKARARFPGERWLHAALETYPFAEPCQGVICWDTLFHIERRHHAAILAGIARCLPPGGPFTLTVGGASHPPFTDTMFGESFYYDSFPPDTVVAMLRDAGFVLLLENYLNLPTAGRDKGRYAIIARKRDEAP